RKESLFQVGTDLRTPGVLAQVARPAGGRAADIVHQHIDAPEALDAGLHHDLDRRGAGDIALMGDDLAAGRFHPLDGFRDAVEIAVDGENLCAFLGETRGNGATVTPAGADAAGAGDDRDAVLQAPAHAFVPQVNLRAGAKR